MHSIPSVSDFTEFFNQNLKTARNSASIGAKYGGIIASSVYYLRKIKKYFCLGLLHYNFDEFLQRKR